MLQDKFICPDCNTTGIEAGLCPTCGIGLEPIEEDTTDASAIKWGIDDEEDLDLDMTDHDEGLEVDEEEPSYEKLDVDDDEL